MTHYSPKNERIKKEYFRFLKEADRKTDSTIDAIRKAISRFEGYSGYKDLATFNREQAIGFKKHLASSRGARTGQPMAKSTLAATANALKHFFRWLSYQPGYRARLRVTDIDYFNLSEKETRAAKEPCFKTFPTLEQVRAVVRSMPAATDIARRNRAVIATTILTGARDSALASLRLKHVDLERRLVMQDPREVRTKRSKRIDTFFFPVGEEFEAIVTDWVQYLREQMFYGNDDPVFPRTRVTLDENGSFAADGLEPVFWENTEPIRRIPGRIRRSGPVVLPTALLPRHAGPIWRAPRADDRALQGMEPEPWPRACQHDADKLWQHWPAPPGRAGAVHDRC